MRCGARFIKASATEIAEEAAAIQRDLLTGTLASAASNLAALGGAAKRNCLRDFHRRFSFKESLELYHVPLPLTIGEGLVPMPIYLPHELLSCLHGLGWAEFSGVLFGGLPECAQGMFHTSGYIIIFPNRKLFFRAGILVRARKETCRSRPPAGPPGCRGTGSARLLPKPDRKSGPESRFTDRKQYYLTYGN